MHISNYSSTTEENQKSGRTMATVCHRNDKVTLIQMYNLTGDPQRDRITLNVLEI